MNFARPLRALLVLPLLTGIATPLACSPSAGDAGLSKGHGTNLQGGNGGNGTSGNGAGAAAGNGGDVLGGGNAGNAGNGTGSGSGSGGDQGCGESFGAEKILVDATVTDTIVAYSPIAIFIMQDRSSSMVGVLGDPQSWPNSTAAITGFVHDPASAGIDIGLGVFPPMTNGGDCSGGTDCGKPLVDIASLPGNAQAMIDGYATANPASAGIQLTPTECALRGMMNECIAYQKQASEKCVAVLVTDGSPTVCDTNTTNLTKLVSDGLSAGILTFALGLPGSNSGFLDQLAAAGGTGKAIDVSSGPAAFIAALNHIRSSVSISTKTHVTKSVSKPLVCQWNIPPTPPGEVFDKTLVNVQFTPPGGAKQTFGHVDSIDKCAGVTADAWYYSPPAPAAPTQVIVCPTTCDKLKANGDGQVDVQFGCATNDIIQ